MATSNRKYWKYGNIILSLRGAQLSRRKYRKMHRRGILVFKYLYLKIPFLSRLKIVLVNDVDVLFLYNWTKLTGWLLKLLQIKSVSFWYNPKYTVGWMWLNESRISRFYNTSRKKIVAFRFSLFLTQWKMCLIFLMSDKSLCFINIDGKIFRLAGIWLFKYYFL